VDSSRQRIFNVPRPVLLIMAAICLVHAVIAYGLNDDELNGALVVLAFIPVRYNFALLAAEPWWSGWGAAVWTFVTYAFIHIDFSHLFFNAVWLLAFGTPVSRRFGAMRFCIFFLVTAAAGAAIHLAVHFGERAPMIGASAAISGAMAAAMRFMFQQGGPIAALGGGGPNAYWVPAVPLSTMLRDRRVLVFLVVWFGVNFVFGIGIVSLPGTEQTVAWEAHIGGFLAGLVCFSWFDPPARSIDPEVNDTQPLDGTSDNMMP
jgi:membrane associated rhomboid family serine protease